MARILLIGLSYEEVRYKEMGKPTRPGTVRLVLEKIPHEVTETDTALNALELAKELKPDLIFISYRTKLIVSTEAIRMLRECKQTRKIPIIMTVTMDLPQSEQDRLREMCDDVLELPTEEPHLIRDTIDQFLKPRQPTIFVAENDYDTLQLTMRILKSIGECAGAETAEEALGALAVNANDFNIVLIDATSHNRTNGIGIAGVVRHVAPDMPIVFIDRAPSDDFDLQYFAELLRVEGIIEGPFEPETLQQTVLAILANKKS